MKKSLSFDDVLLQPKYSDIESRSQVDIGNHLSETAYLELPVISSPMDTVTEAKMAIAVGEKGGIGVIHRNLSVKKQIQEIRKTKSKT